VRQQDAYQQMRKELEGAVKTMRNTLALFNGNTSVADCMPLPSLM